MDIVERLRIRADLKSPNDFVKQRRIETEAADEIDRLRKDYALAWENHLLHEQIFVLTEAKIERLRDALRWAAPDVKDDPRVSALIQAALKEGE